MNLRHFYFIQYVKQNILIHIKKLIFFSKCDCAHLILSSVFISFLLIIAGYKVHIERQLLLVAHESMSGHGAWASHGPAPRW